MTVRFENLPPRIAKLPVDERGYPIPYFVEIIDDKPDFRVMNQRHLIAAIKFSRCWICGEQLGRYKAFTIGPMCCINRISAEPPSHYECARFAVSACPFLSQPMAKRNKRGMPDGSWAPGIMLERNPEVTCIWVTRDYTWFREGDGLLFRIDEPDRISFWRDGRLATRAEVDRSVNGGIHHLDGLAIQQSGKAVRQLEEYKARFRRLLEDVLPVGEGS
ncbi:hypothetical protein [Sinorhizobium fredii]|uniref:hypothetical protein n=1 Tax=Rhizobium fredii TaxID=380 RepID=UPI0004B77F5A|nr:hypothetical protein [Sinorhizobium fredii]